LIRRCRAAYAESVQDREFGNVGVDSLAFASVGWNPRVGCGAHAASALTASFLQAAEVDANALSEEAHFRVCVAQGITDFVLNDPVFGASVRASIRPRLAALYRFTLLGPELLDHPEHPVWRLLAALDQLAPLLPLEPAQDPALMTSVSAALEQCPSGDDLALVVESLADSLVKFCCDRERRVHNIVRRQINAIRGRERWILARDQAEQCVSMALAGHEAFPAIQGMLEGLWVDVLTLLALRNGANSPRWRAAEKTAKALIVLGGTRYRGTRLERLDLRALENNIQVGLRMVGAGQPEHVAVAQILEAVRCHQSGSGDHDTLRLLVSESSALARRRPTSEPGDELVRIPIQGIGAQRETAVQELCTWPTPMWVHVGAEADAPEQYLSWVWSNAKTGHCLLVNHAGHAAWTHSLLEAADAYVSGRLIPEVASTSIPQQRFLRSWANALNCGNGADKYRH